jgi:hypothetical protein
MVPAKLTALYYPHIAIEDEGLLNNALFLWDQVELICPFDTFPYLPDDPERRAAFEAIARPLRPSGHEMAEAHEAILESQRLTVSAQLIGAHTARAQGTACRLPIGQR